MALLSSSILVVSSLVTRWITRPLVPRAMDDVVWGFVLLYNHFVCGQELGLGGVEAPSLFLQPQCSLTEQVISAICLVAPNLCQTYKAGMAMVRSCTAVCPSPQSAILLPIASPLPWHGELIRYYSLLKGAPVCSLPSYPREPQGAVYRRIYATINFLLKFAFVA